MTATMARSRRRRGGLVGKIRQLSAEFTSAESVGGSIDKDSRVIDSKGALLLGGVTVAEVGVETPGEDGGELVLAIELTGQLQGSGERVNPLILATPDTAALLIAQITVVGREGRVGPELDHALHGRMEELLGAKPE